MYNIYIYTHSYVKGGGRVLEPGGHCILPKIKRREDLLSFSHGTSLGSKSESLGEKGPRGGILSRFSWFIVSLMALRLRPPHHLFTRLMASRLFACSSLQSHTHLRHSTLFFKPRCLSSPCCISVIVFLVRFFQTLLRRKWRPCSSPSTEM